MTQKQRSHIRYLSRSDVEAVDLQMCEIITTLERLFEERGSGRVEMPPKPGIHPREDCSIRAMLAYLPHLDAAGLKWISGYANNFERGLPNINGLLILNDSETGIPSAIMDANWITAKRTGAATAVAAQYLANSTSSTLGVVACGALGRTNLEALALQYDLEEIRAYDINPEAAERFAEEMSEQMGLAVRAVQELEKAVRDMDIVVTSGPIVKDPTPVISDSWLKPGSFCCPLDFDSLVDSAAFKGTDRLITDDIPQLEYFRRQGYFQETPDPHADIGALATGSTVGRQSESERTVSINLGVAMHDVAVGMKVLEAAEKLGVGTELSL